MGTVNLGPAPVQAYFADGTNIKLIKAERTTTIKRRHTNDKQANGTEEGPGGSLGRLLGHAQRREVPTDGIGNPPNPTPESE